MFLRENTSALLSNICTREFPTIHRVEWLIGRRIVVILNKGVIMKCCKKDTL